MIRRLVLTLAGFAIAAGLAACDDTRASSEHNFRMVVSRQLAEHGQLCIGRHQWPADLRDDTGPGVRDRIQLPALEQAGLARSSPTRITVKNRDGSMGEVDGRRYVLTELGERYYVERPLIATRNPDARRPDVCYAQLSLDRVVRWDPPHLENGAPTTAVWFTYRIDAADWTQKPEIRKAFPMIAKIVDGAGKLKVHQRVQLQADGWHAI
ncbi:MAG: hypothetical protein QM661_12505 [Solimonas sp.]